MVQRYLLLPRSSSIQHRQFWVHHNHWLHLRTFQLRFCRILKVFQLVLPYHLGTFLHISKPWEELVLVQPNWLDPAMSISDWKLYLSMQSHILLVGATKGNRIRRRCQWPSDHLLLLSFHWTNRDCFNYYQSDDVHDDVASDLPWSLHILQAQEYQH